MHLKELHSWDIELKQAAPLQRALAQQLEFRPLEGPIRRVAGVDVSYALNSTLLVAGVMVLDAETLELLEEATLVGHTDVPYVPGFLSFREVPSLLKVLAQLKIPPDLIVCDGQGIAHPRRLGVASHLGLWTQIPTIGCAKSALIPSPIPGPERGDRAEIIHRGERVGYTLRTRNQVKPVFVSPGHLITQEEACDWVLKLAPKWRLPETTRRADKRVGEIMKVAKAQKKGQRKSVQVN